MQQPADAHLATPNFIDDLSERLLRWSRFVPSHVGRVIDAVQLEPDTRLLDVGCGTGVLLARAAYAEPSAVLIGIDEDEEYIEMARTRVLNAPGIVEINHGRAQGLPFTDGYFDVVTCNFLLSTLAAEDRAAVLAECLRVLKYGGRIVAAEPAASDCSVLRVSTNAALSIAPSWLGEMLPQIDLERELAAAGFVRRIRLDGRPWWAQLYGRKSGGDGRPRHTERIGANPTSWADWSGLTRLTNRTWWGGHIAVVAAHKRRRTKPHGLSTQSRRGRRRSGAAAGTYDAAAN
jgi:SAM-dependent methyltransferase